MVHLHFHAFQFSSVQFSSVQSLSHVLLFVTPWIAAPQACLSITNSRRSLKLTSIESVMPSSRLILCRPLLLLPPIPPHIRVFSNESTWGGQSTGVSALASFLPKNTEDWSLPPQFAPYKLQHSSIRLRWWAQKPFWSNSFLSFLNVLHCFHSLY